MIGVSPTLHRTSQRSMPLRHWVSLYAPMLLALLMRVASSSTASLSYLVLAGFALMGRGQAILALTLSWLFTMINPDIVVSASGGGAGRYAVILAAAFTALFRSGFSLRHLLVRFFTLSTILLTVFLIVHSALLSPIPDVSILKALSWGLTMTALLSLWQGLSTHEFNATANRIYWGLATILIVSLPFLGLRAGFAVNGTGFQGVLNHPQAFGMTMALLGAWSGARMLAERQPPWIFIILTGSSLVLVFLSEARTSGLALVLGVGLSLILSPVYAGRKFLQMAPGFRSGRVWLVIGSCVIAILTTATAFSELIAKFLSKSNRAGTSNLLEAYDASRGPLIDAMLANIAIDPFRGIGFGIASHPSMMIVERDTTFGLPLGAAIEKGVAPLAVLEEIGALGAALVALWVLRLVRRGAVGGLVPFAVCLTALALNMGEYTLFSPGGQGLLAMVLFGWIYASGEQAIRHA